MPNEVKGRFAKPTAADKRAIERADRFMEAFAKIDHTMPSSYIRMFLKVATEPGKGITDYANDLGIYQAVSSRLLLEIGAKSRAGGPGLGLVEALPHPTDMRAKNYFLTESGYALLEEVLESLKK